MDCNENHWSLVKGEASKKEGGAPGDGWGWSRGGFSTCLGKVLAGGKDPPVYYNNRMEKEIAPAPLTRRGELLAVDRGDFAKKQG